VVLMRPSITIQPVSQSVAAGGSVTLSVSASGNPLPINFRWRRGATTLTNMSLYATNSFFTLDNLQVTTTNQFSYNVAITNLAGNAFASSNAVITVLADEDSDGLPDEWETAYGLNAPDEDPDGDGRSNLEEYRSGTNPTNAVDVVRLDCAGDGLRFDAQPAKTYSVLGSHTVEGPWTTVIKLPARATARQIYVPWPTNSFFRLQTP
jgi:hypothetical protein